MVNPSALNSDRSVVTVAPIVIVAGTATDVGKTWLAARLIERLSEAGWIVSARKPVQSFDQADDPNGRDASVLAAASGESRDVVCPPHRSYELAMAPPIAAELLGRSRGPVRQSGRSAADRWYMVRPQPHNGILRSGHDASG